MNSKLSRMRRAKKTRAKIKELGVPSLCVHRTSQHIYAQLIMPDGKVVSSISTLSAVVKKEYAYGGNIRAAAVLGKEIALKIKDLGIDEVAFDRSGFKYHGRVKALADAARLHGLKF